jgi:hypothetical protein
MIRYWSRATVVVGEVWMLVEKVKTIEGVSGGWFQRHSHEIEPGGPFESMGTSRLEAPICERTVFVPARVQPMDIVEGYPYDLPFPMFCAGSPKLNKEKVEYIASAMADPDLRWEKMCTFTVARYQLTSVKQAEISMGGLCYNPEEFVGKNVLVSGHHSFMAFLLCGLPPSDHQPIRINLARVPVQQVYPWWMVFWE